MKKKLNKLSDVTNRSLGQTSFLFELCDKNFKKLVFLEQKLKNNFVCYCPGDKTEVEKVLSMDDGSGWAFANENYSHLDDFLKPEDKFGKECTFKETGYKGIIKRELSHEKGKFGAQWGICWYDGRDGAEHSTRIKEKGLPYYWNRKDKIDFQR